MQDPRALRRVVEQWQCSVDPRSFAERASNQDWHLLVAAQRDIESAFAVDAARDPQRRSSSKLQQRVSQRSPRLRGGPWICVVAAKRHVVRSGLRHDGGGERSHGLALAARGGEKHGGHDDGGWMQWHEVAPRRVQRCGMVGAGRSKLGARCVASRLAVLRRNRWPNPRAAEECSPPAAHSFAPLRAGARATVRP